MAPLLLQDFNHYLRPAPNRGAISRSNAARDETAKKPRKAL
jgi:hypothetical protein